MQVAYTASATATGDGRSGHVRSSDGVLDFDLAVPKEMGGPGGALTNPEQLFAAGYAACFHSALKGVARRAKVDLTDTAITVDVGIGARDEGGSASPSPSKPRSRPSTRTGPATCSKPPTRCARTPTPPAATSRSPSRSPELTVPAQ